METIHVNGGEYMGLLTSDARVWDVRTREGASDHTRLPAHGSLARLARCDDNGRAWNIAVASERYRAGSRAL